MTKPHIFFHAGWRNWAVTFIDRQGNNYCGIGATVTVAWQNFLLEKARVLGHIQPLLGRPSQPF